MDLSFPAVPAGAQVVPLAEAKDRRTPGLKFTNARGAMGVVLATYNAQGQLEAEFACTVPGCSSTHVRGLAEWHWAGKCRAHARGRTGTGTPRPSRLMPGDGPETIALKQERNRLLAEGLAARTREKAEAEKQARIRAEIDRLKTSSSVDGRGESWN